MLTELFLPVKCAQKPIRWPATLCVTPWLSSVCRPSTSEDYHSSQLCSTPQWAGFAIYKGRTCCSASAWINKNYPCSPVRFCSVMIWGSLVQAARVIWSLSLSLFFIIPSSELKGVSLCVCSSRSHYLWCRTMAHFPAHEGFVKSDDMIMGVIPFSVSSHG